MELLYHGILKMERRLGKMCNDRDRVVLYGAGKRCKRLCDFVKSSDIEVAAILDSNPDQWGKKIGGYVIESPERLYDLENISICITPANLETREAIREELQSKYQFDLKREIHYNELILEAYEKDTLIRDFLQGIDIRDGRKETVLFSLKGGFVLGGIEAWTIGLCDALIRDGQKEIYVIAGEGSPQAPDTLKRHVISVKMDESLRFSRESVLNTAKEIAKRLPCKVVTTQPDEIMLAAYLVKCVYPNAVEIISTIRGGWDKIYDSYMDFRKCPDVYIGVSQDIKNDMMQRGIAPEKILTMSVPFVCEKELKHTYTDPQQPICVGYAGRMENVQKRMDLLLKLIKELDRRQIDFKMELAGDGPVREEMERVIVSEHLNDRVKFLGRISRAEIPAFWKKQDICVNIADYEGRSHSIIEAMGNGAVPVVTCTSGVREDITDDKNGYIVSLGDYLSMTEKIAYLAKNRERLAEMGKLAHDAVYPKSRMENHLKFWKDVLSHKVW